jgi:hypothetical protein
MAETVALRRLARNMGHHPLDSTRLYTQGTATNLREEAETIAWA